MTKVTITFACGHTREHGFGSFTPEQIQRLIAGMSKQPCIGCQAEKARKRNKRTEKYHRYF